MNDLIKLVEQWAEEKDLLHAENAGKQFMKFMEEAIEFKEAMTIYKNVRKYDSLGNCNTKYWPDVEMEMGDILVTLIILSKQLDIDLVECLEMAYRKISNRTGKTINGTFVKQEDL